MCMYIFFICTWRLASEVDTHISTGVPVQPRHRYGTGSRTVLFTLGVCDCERCRISVGAHSESSRGRFKLSVCSCYRTSMPALTKLFVVRATRHESKKTLKLLRWPDRIPTQLRNA